jgi:hypothetical protein
MHRKQEPDDAAPAAKPPPPAPVTAPVTVTTHTNITESAKPLSSASTAPASMTPAAVHTTAAAQTKPDGEPPPPAAKHPKPLNASAAAKATGKESKSQVNAAAASTSSAKAQTVQARHTGHEVSNSSVASAAPTDGRSWQTQKKKVIKKRLPAVSSGTGHVVITAVPASAVPPSKAGPAGHAAAVSAGNQSSSAHSGKHTAKPTGVLQACSPTNLLKNNAAQHNRIHKQNFQTIHQLPAASLSALAWLVFWLLCCI